MMNDDWLTGHQATLDPDEDPDTVIFVQKFEDLCKHLADLQICDQTLHAYEA